MCLFISVGNANFWPPFYKENNILARDKLFVVKFHINIANRWLFMIWKHNGYRSLFTKLFWHVQRPFFPDTVYIIYTPWYYLRQVIIKISGSRHPHNAHFIKNIQGIVSGLFLEIRLSILKSVALAIFKLLAFNAPTVWLAC